MDTPAEIKSNLRKRLLAERRTLAPATAAEASRRACARILDTAVWRRAEQVLLYMAVRNEVDASPLFEDLRSRGVCVLLPRCRKDEPGELDLGRVDAPGQARRGAFGIPEPDQNACRPPEAFSPNVIVVPGVGFDRRGGRLGFGGGYYDRLLSKPCMREATHIGLAYAFQVLDELPAEPWDRPLHAVATEKEMLWTP